MYYFSAKEKDEESGFYYYGARYQNPMLAMFNQEDPLRDMYPNISSHAYTANNPIKYIDPDGRYIDITESMGSDGKKTVNITFTGTLINNSSKKLSEKQMQGYAGRMSDAIKEYYGGQKEDGTTVNVNVDIAVHKQGDVLDGSRHNIYMVDPDQVPNKDNFSGTSSGNADVGGSSMSISTNTLSNKPETLGTMKGTGLTNMGSSTLERTSAHEFGHLSGLLDRFTSDKNLMIQSRGANAGTIITGSQIQQIKTNYENNKINQGVFPKYK